MILDFHYTVIVAKRINDNDIIAISMEKKKISQIHLYLYLLCVLSFFGK